MGNKDRNSAQSREAGGAADSDAQPLDLAALKGDIAWALIFRRGTYAPAALAAVFLLGGLPHGVYATIYALTPVCVLLLTLKREWRLSLFGGHFVLWPLFVLPGIGLFYGAFHNFTIVDWHPTLVLTGLATLSLAALVFSLDRLAPFQLLRFALVVLMSTTYASGLVVEANGLRESAALQVLPIIVQDKYIVRPPRKVSQYFLQFAPHQESIIPGGSWVRRDLYKAVEPGSHVCMNVRTGALGIRWYSLDACTPTPRTDRSEGSPT